MNNLARLLLCLAVMLSLPALGQQSYPSACTSTAIIAPPATAPFYGISGANTLVASPEPANYATYGCFGTNNPILRVSDGNSGYNQCIAQGNSTGTCNPKHYQTMKVDSSDGEDSLTSIDDSQFASNDSGGTDYIWSLNPSTPSASMCLSNIAGFGGWFLSPATYSHVTAKLLYGMSSAAGITAGTVLKSYLVSSCYPTAPTVTTLYDFASSANGVPNTFIYETDGVSISSTDNIFGTGFSNSATQNTASYVCAYNKAKGAVSCVNTGNGVGNPVVTTDLAWTGGSAGTLECQNCVPGAGPLPIGDFGIHNVKFDPTGTWATIASGNCTNSGTISNISESGSTVTVTFSGLTAANAIGVHIAGYTGAASGYNGNWLIAYSAGSTFTFTANTTGLPTSTASATVGTCMQGASDAYEWQVGTTNIYISCNPFNTATCSGHNISGVNGYYNSYSTPLWEYKPWPGYTGTKWPNSGTWFCTVTGQSGGNHASWWNNKGADQELLIPFDSVGPVNPNYNTCMVQEVFGIYPPSSPLSGQFRRFAHTYGGNNGDFSVQYQLGNMFQSGNFAMFSSNMECYLTTGNCTDPGATPAIYGQLGDTSGNYPAGSQTTARGDVFIVVLGAGSAPPAPSTPAVVMLSKR
jgi:hypothetical protein